MYVVIPIKGKNTMKISNLVQLKVMVTYIARGKPKNTA